MTPEKLFHQMLGLGSDWEVVSCSFEQEQGVVALEIREAPNLFKTLRCPKCAGPLGGYDHTEVMEWRHLNVFEHRCHIRARLPRAQCRDCKHTFRARPPWEGLSSGFTLAFEIYALLLAREMPVARVARATGETDTRLWRLIRAHVEEARAQADFCNVTCVGVDEMSVRKGHHYISVFADLFERKVLFGTPGRDATVWERFVEDLDRHNGHPHALTQVSMDMSRAYQKGVAEHCRNARVVFDKYHVIAKVNAAVDQTRKAESSGVGAPAPKALRKTMWIWRKNPENLTPKEKARLEELNCQNLWTTKAYQMRLNLQQIYWEEQPEQAREKFLDWCRLARLAAQTAPKVIFAAMVGAAKMIEDHLEGILAHWQHRVTNAYMEGLNSVFSATKRKARGYRSLEYLLTMLYLVAGKLSLPQSTHCK
jgi:transposase